ncbi:MAG: N-acetylmuramoyl-L-alanine amidase, partial [Muribaculaceae bacterium]|nr:N-acetylmuramoyl-L-alanine amidase [Muribaculaceae bacterium]
MNITRNRFYTVVLGLVLAILMVAGLPAGALAAQTKDFVVVLDAGHGGKDHGAIDNGVKEKDINLAVALRLGELIKKKLKNTKVVYTRDDDTFVSLQGRADIANKAKGDLFISIHTNSVDAKNKNRRTVAGATVYTQGSHKDEANLAVAKRENSVIELENGYEQKYSGFDPNKVESYIIFEMAAKQNLAQSHRFAKSAQENLVKIAGRKDRGVHQAGFWVLWATSMPSALVELDFICNPESAKFMGSKSGVDKLAEALFEAVKTYEQNFMQKQRMMARAGKSGETSGSGFAGAVRAGVTDHAPATASAQSMDASDYAVTSAYPTGATDVAAVATRALVTDEKDMSHTNLKATTNQRRARHAADGRRRRSATARSASEARDLSVNHILVAEELTEVATADAPV